MNIGEVITDAIRNIFGSFDNFYSAGVKQTSGIMKITPYGPTPAKQGVSGVDPGENCTISIDASLKLPTSFENRPASISFLPCISY